MLEKDFQVRFGKWLKHVHCQTGLFELKLSRGKSLPFDAVAPHQIDALMNAKHGTLVYKIPDVGYQNPADCFCLSGVPAFIVVQYASGVTYLIDIDEFCTEWERSDRKSLTEDTARMLSTHVIAK